MSTARLINEKLVVDNHKIDTVSLFPQLYVAWALQEVVDIVLFVDETVAFQVLNTNVLDLFDSGLVLVLYWLLLLLRYELSPATQLVQTPTEWNLRSSLLQSSTLSRPKTRVYLHRVLLLVQDTRYLL
jgi:hypothetical protein